MDSGQMRSLVTAHQEGKLDLHDVEKEAKKLLGAIRARFEAIRTGAYEDEEEECRPAAEQDVKTLELRLPLISAAAKEVPKAAPTKPAKETDAERRARMGVPKGATGSGTAITSALLGALASRRDGVAGKKSPVPEEEEEDVWEQTLLDLKDQATFLLEPVTEALKPRASTPKRVGGLELFAKHADTEAEPEQVGRRPQPPRKPSTLVAKAPPRSGAPETKPVKVAARKASPVVTPVVTPAVTTALREKTPSPADHLGALSRQGSHSPTAGAFRPLPPVEDEQARLKKQAAAKTKGEADVVDPEVQAKLDRERKIDVARLQAQVAALELQAGKKTPVMKLDTPSEKLGAPSEVRRSAAGSIMSTTVRGSSPASSMPGRDSQVPPCQGDVEKIFAACAAATTDFGPFLCGAEAAQIKGESDRTRFRQGAIAALKAGDLCPEATHAFIEAIRGATRARDIDLGQTPTTEEECIHLAALAIASKDPEGMDAKAGLPRAFGETGVFKWRKLLAGAAGIPNAAEILFAARSGEAIDLKDTKAPLKQIPECAALFSQSEASVRVVNQLARSSRALPRVLQVLAHDSNKANVGPLGAWRPATTFVFLASARPELRTPRVGFWLSKLLKHLGEGEFIAVAAARPERFGNRKYGPAAAFEHVFRATGTTPAEVTELKKRQSKTCDALVAALKASAQPIGLPEIKLDERAFAQNQDETALRTQERRLSSSVARDAAQVVGGLIGELPGDTVDVPDRKVADTDVAKLRLRPLKGQAARTPQAASTNATGLIQSVYGNLRGAATSQAAQGALKALRANKEWDFQGRGEHKRSTQVARDAVTEAVVRRALNTTADAEPLVAAMAAIGGDWALTIANDHIARDSALAPCFLQHFKALRIEPARLTEVLAGDRQRGTKALTATFQLCSAMDAHYNRRKQGDRAAIAPAFAGLVERQLVKELGQPANASANARERPTVVEDVRPEGAQRTADAEARKLALVKMLAKLPPATMGAVQLDVLMSLATTPTNGADYTGANREGKRAHKAALAAQKSTRALALKLVKRHAKAAATAQAR